MQSSFKNSWPPSRNSDEEIKWKHSDVKEIGYSFIYKLFDSFKSEGKLDE